MAKYVCSICGYTYDEEVGEPEQNIAKGTTWDKVPKDYTCPLCGAGKEEFKQE